LAVDDKWNEKPADAVAFEVNRDGEAGSVVGKWRDGDVDDWSMCTSSEVLGRSAKPIRRRVTHRVPTLGMLGCSMWPLTTPFCHSEKWVGSVA